MRIGITLLAATLAGGCMTTGYTGVERGQIDVGDLELTTMDARWNKAPRIAVPYLQPGSELWTRDGALLDRLYVLNGIGHGQTLFKSSNKALAFPAFRADMLPNEVAELTVDSLAKLMGPQTIITSDGLRPASMNGRRAAMFDLKIIAAEAPEFRGRTIVCVADRKLYVLVFVAADIYYFDKHWPVTDALMQSARLDI